MRPRNSELQIRKSNWLQIRPDPEHFYLQTYPAMHKVLTSNQRFVPIILSRTGVHLETCSREEDWGNGYTVHCTDS
jgi:hypothetical protein